MLGNVYMNTSGNGETGCTLMERGPSHIVPSPTQSDRKFIAVTSLVQWCSHKEIFIKCGFNFKLFQWQKQLL